MLVLHRYSLSLLLLLLSLVLLYASFGVPKPASQISWIIEQFEVHLGSALKFNCHLDAMLIDTEWLDRRWAHGQAATQALAKAASRSERKPTRPGLLAALSDLLLDQIEAGPTLERTAQCFELSPATLKRHLAQHGSSFQAELDQARTRMALALFYFHGCDNEQVAQRLGFHDANNFRRSFKRWTGLTPSRAREALPPGRRFGLIGAAPA